MQLTDNTFKKMMGILHDTYTDWGLSSRQESIWRHVLASKVSDELLARIVPEWIANESKPPKVPADLVHYLDEKIKKQFDSAEVSAEIIISGALSAYRVTDEFESFKDMYRDSFAAAISGAPEQEAYIKEQIRTRSSNPKVLILVYDEVKGDLKDCFTGDAEHGIEFLRNQIKKKWNTQTTEIVNAFLKSGKTDYRMLSRNNKGLLEA